MSPVPSEGDSRKREAEIRGHDEGSGQAEIPRGISCTECGHEEDGVMGLLGECKEWGAENTEHHSAQAGIGNVRRGKDSADVFPKPVLSTDPRAGHAAPQMPAMGRCCHQV